MEKNIKIEKAAELMGKSAQFVRVGLQRGKLPFGTAIKTSTKWNYYIVPYAFYSYIGRQDLLNKEIFGGEKNGISNK